MQIIGITGGIGSGKSTICKIFSLLGIPIFDSDTETKELYNTDAELKSKIIHFFGAESYTNAGFNKPYIAGIVFKDTEKIKTLNAIVHPFVQKRTEEWMAQHTNQKYVLKESAILIESGAYKKVNKILYIQAPIELRIQRVMQRSNFTEADVRKRIQLQMPEEEKIKLADYIIYNNEKELLIPQVLALHMLFSNK